jgi:hypothetical protein
MKKAWLLLMLLPIQIFAQAQESAMRVPNWVEANGQSLFHAGHIAETTDENALLTATVKFLKEKLPDLQDSRISLRKQSLVESPFGTHISFCEIFEGQPIYATDIKVNIDKNGDVSSVLYKTASTSTWPSGAAFSEPDEGRIRQMIGTLADVHTVSKVWFTDGKSATPAFCVEYEKSDGQFHKEVVVNMGYEQLYLDNKLMQLKSGPDSLATGYVFYPDPLTSAQRPYGAPYADFNDSAVPALDYERVPMPMRVQWDGDSFYLSGPYIRIVDISPPYTIQPASKGGIFNYSRHDKRFEAVNAYFHINNYQKHIKDLGFSTLGSSQLPVDVHALSGDDQSEFDYFGNDLKLLFGDGGIDDAEDADVIIHEYTHFLSYSASPNNVQGAERESLEEGLCDYMACSYSKNISLYNWQKIYSWDGNESWQGRSCVTSKKYPDDLDGQRYDDSEIWTGSMMDLWDELGRDKTDKLMLGTLYFLGKYISMADAARLLIHTDSLAYGGTDVGVISDRFYLRGLLSKTSGIAPQQEQLSFHVLTEQFSSANRISVDFGKPQSGTIALYDIQGRQLMVQTINRTDKFSMEAPSGLAPGIYVLRIMTDSVHKAWKLEKDQ